MGTSWELHAKLMVTLALQLVQVHVQWSTLVA